MAKNINYQNKNIAYTVLTNLLSYNNKRKLDVPYVQQANDTKLHQLHRTTVASTSSLIKHLLRFSVVFFYFFMDRSDEDDKRVKQLKINFIPSDIPNASG